MARTLEKLRLSRALGLSTRVRMVIFGLLRRLGAVVDWTGLVEVNGFLDSVLDGNGAVHRRGALLEVEQHCARLGSTLKAHLRPGTSDPAVWVQIAGHEEYAVVVERLRELSDIDVATIVDAGANIGLASLYLATAFPRAHILAIEPDMDNYELLVRNVDALGTRVSVVRGAFWPRNEPLRMADAGFRDGRHWARAVERSGRSPRPAAPHLEVIPPAEAAARLGVARVDLLKIDIEGAEAEFFDDDGRAGELLRTAQAIAIEVHPERIDPLRVLLALDAGGFLVTAGRELLIAIRRERLRGAHLPGRPPPR